MHFQSNLEGVTIEKSASVDDLLMALSRRSFNNRQNGFAVIVDEAGRAFGVVSDADIRKFISSNKRSPRTIAEIVNSDYVWVSDTLSREQLVVDLSQKLSARGWVTDFPVRYIPILTDELVPVGIIDLYDLQVELNKYRDRIVVVGLGYVGLTLALAISRSDYSVIGLDSDKVKLEKLNAGISTLYEPGIEEALSASIGKNLHLVSKFSELSNTAGQATIYILCLPTPLKKNKEDLDLSAIDTFLDELISVIKQGDVVVMRSTVPVGTGRQIIGDIEAKKNWSVGSDFYYVEAPERTVEGDALNEIKNLPQLLGGATKFCSEKVVEVFKDISSVVVPTSSIEVCELVKIAGNAFRDHLFAFSNHLAEEARRLNVDVNEVVEKSNLGYSRSTIPHPSPGVGGPCLTKDSYLFTSNYFVDSPARLSRLYNETVPMQVVDFIAASVPEPGSTTAAIFGLAFKGSPRTDDVRSSTNVQVAEALSKILKNVYLWDAVADLGNFGFGTKFEENDPPDTDLALILNNNPDNISVVKNLIYQSQKKTLLVFDPWLMLEPKHLFQNSALDELHYLTMSMKSTYRR